MTMFDYFCCVHALAIYVAMMSFMYLTAMLASHVAGIIL